MKAEEVLKMQAGPEIDGLIARILEEDDSWESYSQDMGKAWKLVERIIPFMEKDSTFDWMGPLYKPKNHHFLMRKLGESAWFVQTVIKDKYIVVHADTPALAICRAFILVSQDRGTG